jgi:hypothetical protein
VLHQRAPAQLMAGNGNAFREKIPGCIVGGIAGVRHSQQSDAEDAEGAIRVNPAARN